jgi:hypothetical protein
MGNVVLSCSLPPPLLLSAPQASPAAAGGTGSGPPQQVTPQPAAGPSKRAVAAVAAVVIATAVTATPPQQHAREAAAAGPRRGSEERVLLPEGEGPARTAPSAHPPCGAHGESFRRRLSDIRRQYSWNEIPFEFFVDAEVTVESSVSPSHIARCVRERSSARKAERALAAERARGPCGVEQASAPPNRPCFAVPA